MVEQHVTDDFTFSAPPDVGIDHATYFERCCPNSATIEAFQYKRLFEAGDEVIVTYEATKTDGRPFRNTEIFGFDGDKISRREVYFDRTSNHALEPSASVEQCGCLTWLSPVIG